MSLNLHPLLVSAFQADSRLPLLTSYVAAAGAKNAKQASEVAGALGWRLTPDEVVALDKESSKLAVGTGAPFENW